MALSGVVAAVAVTAPFCSTVQVPFLMEDLSPTTHFIGVFDQCAFPAFPNKKPLRRSRGGFLVLWHRAPGAWHPHSDS
jgi:hypothetical protein